MSTVCILFLNHFLKIIDFREGEGGEREGNIDVLLHLFIMHSLDDS